MMLFKKRFSVIVRGGIVAIIAAYAAGLFAQPAELTFADSLVLPFVRIDTASIEPSYPILYPQKTGPITFLVIGDRKVTGRIADGWVRRTGGICETVLTRSRTELGIPDPESAGESELLGRAYAEDRLEMLLAGNWDAIWLSFDPASLPAAVQTRIRTLVESGTSLIIDGELDAHARMLGIDRSPSRLALPVNYTSIEPVSGIRVGDGILVSVPVLPIEHGGQVRGDYHNTIAATVQATAGPRETLSIQRVEVTNRSVEHEVIGIQRFRIRYRNESEADSLNIVVRCRDHSGHMVSETRHMVKVARGESMVSLPYPVAPVGTYSLDITCLRDRTLLAFAGTTFSVDTEERIESVKLWESHAPRGDFAIGTMTMTQPFREGMYATAELLDPDGTVLVRRMPEMVPGRKSLDFILPLRAPFPRAVSVLVSFYKNNECVEQVARPFLITDPPPEWPYAFGIGNGSLYPGVTTKEFAGLRESGVSLLIGAADRSAEAGGYSPMLRNAGESGLGIVPDITSAIRSSEFGEEDERDAFVAIRDTLFALDPVAFALNQEEQTDAVRTLLSDEPVLTFSGPGGFTEPMRVTMNGSKHMSQGTVIPEAWLHAADRQRLMAIPWWAALSGYSHFWWPEGESALCMALTPDGRCAPAVNVVGDGAESVRRILGSCWGTSMPFIHNTAVADRIQDSDGVPVSGIGVWDYHDSLAVYLAVAPDPAYSEMPVQERLSLTDWMDETLPYSYDLSNSSFLGISDSVDIQFTDGVFMAVWLPYRVLRLDLNMKTTVYAPDDTLTFQVSVIPSQDASLIRHPFELSVYQEQNDSEENAPFYSRIVGGDHGVYEGNIDLGTFGQGRWQLEIRDLVSGNDVSRRFIIRGEQEWTRE